MRSGFNQVEQNSREFFLDVHAVARNFAGEQDWQWIKDANQGAAAEGQGRPQTRSERFTDEMTVGTQFYSNDSKIEDRIALGVCTALYCLPYVAGRMVYDGVLNSYEYGAWRATGHAYSPLHPEGRKTNGYVLGAAVAVPFITAMAGIESAIRAAGVSERSKHEIALAWNSAGYLLKRWTKVNYNNEADFKVHLREMSKAPVSWMDGMNCIGLLSGGLVVSGVILTVGVLAAGTALLGEGLYKGGRYLGKKAYHGGTFLGESTGRALGISERSGKEINLAWHSAGYLLKRWTGKDYSAHDFRTPFGQLFNRPTSWMDGMDCLGLATGGLLISGVILTVGALTAGTALLGEGLYKSARYLGKKAYAGSLFLGESLGRALGISERSGKEINLAWHSAGYLLKRWTGKDYSAHDFKTTFSQLFNRPTSWMDGMDCLGLATGGLLISGVILTVGALTAGTALLGEGLYKSARYLGKKAYQGSLFLGESLGRALGISERSGKEINLAWHSAGYLLKRWTGKDYSAHDFKTTLRETFKRPTTWMEGMDCLGLATGGLLVSGVILTVGALAAGTALLGEGLYKSARYLGKKAYQGSLFLGESLGRALGISERSGKEINLAWHSAGYLLKRWTDKDYSAHDFKTTLRETFKRPTTWMEGMDCLGLATGGLLVSGVILTVGALAAGTALLGEGLYKSARYLGKKAYQGSLFLGESLGRALGISERSGKEINLAWHSAGYLLKRWTGKDYSAHDFKTTLRETFKRPTTWMEGMDCLGLATGGLLVSGIILTVGALAAGTALLGEGLLKGSRYLGTKAYKGSLFLGESLGRALGISERTGKEINLAWHSAGYLLKRWTGKDYSTHEFKTTLRETFKRPPTWMEGMDCLGLATGGLVVSGVILSIGALAAGTALLGEGLYKSARYLGKKAYQGSLFLGESLGRAVGISERTGKEINLAWHSAGYLLKRWTGKDYSAHDFKTTLSETFKRPTTWMEGMDCLGLATGGLLVSGVILTVGTLAAGTALLGEGLYKTAKFLDESVGRALGISDRSGKQINLAWDSAGFLLKRWTGKNYSAHDFKTTLRETFKRPTTWMEGMDCLGLATGGLLVSGVILTVGTLAAGTALLGEGLYKSARYLGKKAYAGSRFLGESLGRALGISERSGKEINLAWHSASYLLKRWTGKDYSAHAFKTPFSQLFNRPSNWMEGMDCVGLATGGLLVSGIILTVGTLAAGTALLGEGLYKSARYLGKKAYQGGLFLGESLGRALGISERGGKEINLAWHSAGYLLKRWTGKDYSAHAFKTPFSQLFNRPSNWMEGMDCVGLATGSLLVSSIILTVGTLAAGTALLGEGLYKGARFLGKSLGRALGISERAGKEINLAWHSAGYLLKRWTGKDYSAHAFKTPFSQLFNRPTNWMEGMDCVGLATGGLLVSGVILTVGALAAGTALLGEGLYKAAKFTGESIVRALGISERSKSAITVIFAKCGNMFGAADPANLADKIQRVKEPIRSWMDACDCIGTAITATLSGVITVAAASLALVGFSKSNFHRFCYYKHRIGNLIDDRRKLPVNKALEEHHKAELARCEQTTAGNLFSKLNIFNVAAQTTFALARLVIAPTIYAVARIIKGIIPATIRAIGRAIYPKNLENLDDPIVRVRKRFADLNKALNLSGKLPRQPEGDEAPVLQIRNAVEEAEKRDKSFFKRAGFTLFSEGRRIISLGHTPEEKILAEFEDKFEQFVNASRRAERRGEPAVPVGQFFKNDVALPNGKRFSYDYMLNHVKGSFTSVQDQQAIERIAGLLKKDIENEIEPGGPRVMP